MSHYSSHPAGVSGSPMASQGGSRASAAATANLISPPHTAYLASQRGQDPSVPSSSSSSSPSSSFTPSSSAAQFPPSTPRFDGRGSAAPAPAARAAFWAPDGPLYADGQAFGSVVGDLPAFEQYGAVGRMYRVPAVGPRSVRVHQDFRPQSASSAAATAAGAGAGTVLVAAVADTRFAGDAKMERFLAERDDHPSYWISHGGRRA